MKPEACRSVERQATRMLQMMRRLEVDPGTLIRLRHGEAYTEARTRCFACVTTAECLRWLDGYVLDDENPGFCPNLQLFRFLQGKTVHLLLQEPAVQPMIGGRIPGPPAAIQAEEAGPGPN